MSTEDAVLDSPNLQARLNVFVEGGERTGSVAESAIERLAEQLTLGPEVLDDLRDRLAAHDVRVEDDCGRFASSTRYANGDLAYYAVDALDQFLTEAGRHRLLTAAEELELAKRIERGDLAAKERLITHNIRLVVSIARRHPASELTLLDLIQEGMLGLIRAAEKFDWRKGFRFSTYATLWIRQSIGRALSNHSRTIRLPVAVAQRERRLARARAKLVSQLGREPDREELAAAANVAPADIAALDEAARVVVSLDRPVGETGDMVLGDVLVAPGEDVGDDIVLALEREAVRRAVAALGQPDREVIERRFGMDGDPKPESYPSIGQRLGLTAAEVRGIERRALAELSRVREFDALTTAA